MRRRTPLRRMALTSLQRQRCIENCYLIPAAKLTLLRNTTFELAQNYVLILQAWAFFANHYHLVMSFENTARTGHTPQRPRSHPRSAGDV
jgi:hypothetical protein